MKIAVAAIVHTRLLEGMRAGAEKGGIPRDLCVIN